jgi:hypothetical protein
MFDYNLIPFSGITFIRFVQGRKIENQIIKKKKSLGARSPKSLNRIPKFGQGQLCLKEENLSE